MTGRRSRSATDDGKELLIVQDWSATEGSFPLTNGPPPRTARGRYGADVPDVPPIEPLQWADIRTVLSNEAREFTPWLAENLDLLADALSLDELERVRTEQPVDEYRLDIAAVGTDGSGEEIAVAIENQYGRSDHDHLGKLITYTAKADSDAERVLGVWMVEQPTAAHQAAIEFLNRMSAEYAGWVLISPRFVEGPSGYLVHFEKHAEPNAFLRSSAAGTGGRPARPERVAFMASVFEAIEQPLLTTGFRRVWSHPGGQMIRAYLPARWPSANWAEVRVLAQQHRVRVVLFVRGGEGASADQNEAVLEGIRSRHGTRIATYVQDPGEIEWHARHPNDRSDYARYTWEGHGYLDGDPDQAAARVLAFATGCFESLSEDGDEEFPEPEELTTVADTPTVCALASHIEPGEWTTYGDLSSALTGAPSAAMAIGNMARTNPEFPNPHRILNSRGMIPDGWMTTDGTGGPEVCRALLEDGGIQFDAQGRANPEQRLPTDKLRERLPGP